METIRTVELFAGVGGFRLGLESASEKFKVIWANQWEPSMREQYAFDCYMPRAQNTRNDANEMAVSIISLKAVFSFQSHWTSRRERC